jgi:hypothetical protein
MAIHVIANNVIASHVIANHVIASEAKQSPDCHGLAASQ